ncbi:hypothetical protein ACGF07_25650 [Kitasatospora sp. NPDC048194]|uniref:hypothetical protein n=1 Tax=Kitasatospora sp. NPDC048194 TaxID=3364045 RepID=UPI003711A0FC
MTGTPPPSLAERIEHALRIAAVPWAANMPPITQHGDGGHRFETGCSLCHGDAPSLTDAALAVVQPELDRRDAEIDRLRAELVAARDRTLTEAAEMLRYAIVSPNETDGVDAAADLLDAARAATS